MSRYSDLVLAKQPLLYWPLTDIPDSGMDHGDVAQDASPNNRDGTFYDPVPGGFDPSAPLPQPGFEGKRAVDYLTPSGQVPTIYNGDAAALNTIFAQNQPRTYEAWIRRATTGLQMLFCGGTPANQNGLYAYMGNRDVVTAPGGNGSTVTTHVNALPVGAGLNEWVHLVWAYNGNTVSTGWSWVWVNGVFHSAIANWASPTPANNTSMRLGIWLYGPGSILLWPYTGGMAHFAIYPRVLEHAEVAEHYQTAMYGGPLPTLSRRQESPLIEAETVSVRHIKRETAGGVAVAGSQMVPQDRRGVNGEGGWQQGSIERRLYEEGAFAVAFPNGVGGDDIMHRERFKVTSTREQYRPGDEWVEVYRDDSPSPLFVGTPIRPKLGRAIEIAGSDGLELLKKVRETAACHWHHAPRDVWEHYTNIWRAVQAENFGSASFVYDEDSVTTTGLLRYRAAENITTKPGEVRLRPGVGVGLSGAVEGTQPVTLVSTGAVWRAEWSVSRINANPSNGMTFGVTDKALGDGADIGLLLNTVSVYVSLIHREGGLALAFASRGGGVNLVEYGSVGELGNQPNVTVAIESRERWVYFYVNGRLVGVLPQPSTTAVNGYARVEAGGVIDVINPPADGDVTSFLVRRHEPFLLRGSQKGDYRLPGAPPQGGLIASYFADQDRAISDSADNRHRVLAPDRKPYALRSEETIDSYSDGTDAWIPPGPPDNDDYSVRWVGSVYLDLSNYDVAFRVQLRGRCRLWIGKTQFGQQIIDQWGAAESSGATSNWLKAGNAGTGAPSGATGPLAGMASGWYPIVIEYARATAVSTEGGITLQVERSDAVGTWVLANSDDKARFSPLGVYEGQPRYESHYEVLKALAETFGYQYTCEPRSLESGEFPGQVIPRIRQGRDTDYILNELEEANPQTELDAGQVADSLLADAQGLADPDEAAQLKAELLNYDQLSSHLLIHQEYDTPSDITNPELLLQRLQSLLALRGSPWETVQAQPLGSRELRDYFPLTGAPALFAWEPGDGVRLSFPSVGVEDTGPRQMLGVARPIRPAGVGQASVTFRQRPRSFAQVIRDLYAAQRRNQRHYQGQLVAVVGNLAGSGGDAQRYSVAPLPDNAVNIVRATFIVHTKKQTGGGGQADTSAWTIEVNGALGRTFKKPGRYDITSSVRRYNVTDPRVIARAVRAGVGTGRCRFSVELLVRV